ASGSRRDRRDPRYAGLSLRSQHRPYGRWEDRGSHPPERSPRPARSGARPSSTRGGIRMKRYTLLVIGILAALWATFSIVRTQPRRERTDPPTPPPISDFSETVAAVGLVEASTENISVGTPLSEVVASVFVSAGQTVKRNDPLFDLDTRHLRAD